jgi:hypothetical protein
MATKDGSRPRHPVKRKISRNKTSHLRLGSSYVEKCEGFSGYGDADPSISPLVHGAEIRVAETWLLASMRISFV